MDKLTIQIECKVCFSNSFTVMVFDKKEIILTCNDCEEEMQLEINNENSNKK